MYSYSANIVIWSYCIKFGFSAQSVSMRKISGIGGLIISPDKDYESYYEY